jgi:hypothetical protein
MLNLGLQRDWGDLNFFYLPYFRERTFPGTKGRLRAPLVVDTDRARYEASQKEWYPSVALRYATVLGDWDIGLAQFHGTGRAPRLLAEADANGAIRLIPVYDIVDRSSVDIQATVEEWLWKFEGIYQTARFGSFFAASAGLEYTFFGSVGDAGDLGVIAEWHYDGRDRSAPLTMFDDDIFLRARLTVNNADSTTFLGGIIFDSDSHAKAISLEAETRLSDIWKLEVEPRLYEDLTAGELLYSIRHDDQLQARFSRYL